MTKEEQLASLAGERNFLEYLITVAQKTGGSEVWRALFAEILRSTENKIKELKG